MSRASAARGAKKARRVRGVFPLVTHGGLDVVLPIMAGLEEGHARRTRLLAGVRANFGSSSAVRSGADVACAKLENPVPIVISTS